jgi:hypothetical protein
VYLGRLFNDRVSELSAMLGDATGLVLATLAAIVLLVVLVQRWRAVA